MYPYPPMKNNFKCVQWRVDVLHTQVVEAVYRKHVSSTLFPLFQAYAEVGYSTHQFLRPEGWFALLDALAVLPCDGGQGQMNTWDRVWLWQISAMSHADELTTSQHLEFVFVEFLEAFGRLVGLLHSRKLVAEATPEDSQWWEYGLGAPSAASIFCIDKEGVMNKDIFAGYLDVFFSTTAKSLVTKLRARTQS